MPRSLGKEWRATLLVALTTLVAIDVPAGCSPDTNAQGNGTDASTDAGTVDDAAVVDATDAAVEDGAVGDAAVEDAAAGDAAERTVDDPVSGPALGRQRLPQVAFDGTNFLVVWVDERAQVDVEPIAASALIYAARVSPTSGVLDPSGILVGGLLRGTLTMQSTARPAVSFDGTNYLIVWKQVDLDASYAILGRRVAPSGTLIDAAPFVIAPKTSTILTFPRSAFDGTNHLVIWNDQSSAGSVRAARVSAAGLVLDPNGIVLAADAGASLPAIGCSTASCYAAWSSGASLYARRLGASDGGPSLLGPTTLGQYGSSNELGAIGPAVSVGSELALVTAPPPSGDTSHALLRYALRPDGGVGWPLPDGGVQNGVALPSDGFPASQSWSAFDGSRHRVVWSDTRDLSDLVMVPVSPDGGVPVGADGGASPPARVPTTDAGAMQPSIVCAAASCLTAWQESEYAPRQDVYAARIDPSGAPDPTPLLVSTSANNELLPVAASDADGAFVVWLDDREPPLRHSLFGARIGPDGTSRDRTALPIASFSISPSVAAGHDTYAVAATKLDSSFNNVDARLYRVRKSDGALLDPSGIILGANATYAAVGFDGTNYLAAWVTQAQGSSYASIYAARVGPDGGIIDTTPITISATLTGKSQPVVAFDGKSYLIARQDQLNDNGDLFGRRVGPDGTLLDAGLPIPIAVAPGVQTRPTITATDSGFFVAWTDNRNDPGANDIYGARVTSDGKVLDSSGIQICVDPAAQDAPSVIFDTGSKRVIASWADLRARSSWDIYGAAVDGGVVGPATPIASSADQESAPEIASSKSGAPFLFYEHHDPTPPFGSFRLRVRRLGL